MAAITEVILHLDKLKGKNVGVDKCAGGGFFWVSLTSSSLTELDVTIYCDSEEAADLLRVALLRATGGVVPAPSPARVCKKCDERFVLADEEDAASCDVCGDLVHKDCSVRHGGSFAFPEGTFCPECAGAK